MAAPVVTALAVGVGVADQRFHRSRGTGSASGSLSAAARPAQATATTRRVRRRDRTLGTSRSVERVPLVDNRVPKAKGKLWTTADLDLRIEPREKARTVGLVEVRQAGARSPASSSGTTPRSSSGAPPAG